MAVCVEVFVKLFQILHLITPVTPATIVVSILPLTRLQVVLLH